MIKVTNYLKVPIDLSRDEVGTMSHGVLMPGMSMGLSPNPHATLTVTSLKGRKLYTYPLHSGQCINIGVILKGKSGQSIQHSSIQGTTDIHIYNNSKVTLTLDPCNPDGMSRGVPIIIPPGTDVLYNGRSGHGVPSGTVLKSDIYRNVTLTKGTDILIYI